MTIEVTFELNVPLDGPLEQVVSSVIESVNKIYEARQLLFNIMVHSTEER